MGFYEQALAALGGNDREHFLIALAFGVAFAARGEYAEAGNDEMHALIALRSVNEMMIVITDQIKSSRSGKPAYPDDAFLRVLKDNAAIGGSENVFFWALENAIDDLKSRRRGPEPAG